MKKTTMKKVPKYILQLKKYVMRNYVYINGGYSVIFKGQIFASNDLKSLFNDIKKEYLNNNNERK
tara:strand:- start:439 stop:633 length:195 start_codon:yes stop_codon:yes gene_type:complete